MHTPNESIIDNDKAMDNPNNSSSFVQSYYEYQKKVCFPDNASFCPSGSNWKFALGIRNSPIAMSSRYSNQGSTNIGSNPDKADVFVDGEYKGKTPLNLIDICDGKHLLMIKLPSYCTAEQEISSDQHIFQEIHINLNKIDINEESFDLMANNIWQERWDDELCNIIDNYKIFWDVAFRRFLKLELGLERLNTIAKEAKITVNQKYAYEDALRHLISFTIRKMSKNAIYLEKFQAAIKSLDRKIQCKICGRIFRPLDSHRINFDVFNGEVECCNSCVARCIWPDYGNSTGNNEKEKSLMLKDLADLFGLTGIIPPSRVEYEYIKMFPRDARTKALSLMSKMLSRDSYKKVFGSWFKSLVASGILNNASLKTSRGIRCLALDGHECFSLLEKQFDDFLYINGVAHSKEPYYPEHSELNPNNLLRADYLINGTFVEIWGLIGEEKYDEKIERKRILAKQKNIDLVEIKPSDFVNLESKIRKHYKISTFFLSKNLSN